MSSVRLVKRVKSNSFEINSAVTLYIPKLGFAPIETGPTKLCCARENLDGKLKPGGSTENQSGREEVTPRSSKRGKLLHSDKDRLHLDETSGCFTFAVR